MQEHDFDVEKETQVKADIHSLLEQEDVKWKQRAKENWLKFGDRNAKFFHASASQKNNRHRIHNILDQEGRQCSSQEERMGLHQLFSIFIQCRGQSGCGYQYGCCSKKGNAGYEL
jgi:hypothetical protein